MKNNSVGRLIRQAIFFTSGILTAVFTTQAQVNVTTFRNDNARDGQNLSEWMLTPANVNANQFGRLFVQPLDGVAYAQPLYVSSLPIAGGTHNVVFAATEHDSVYAFDADNNIGANANPLWHVSFINPAAGITTVDSVHDLDCTDISPEVGITGTPVIDLSSNTLYVVAKTKENGAFLQRLHALDIASGAEKFGGPVVIQASVPGTGDGSTGGQVAFNPLTNNQRPGLLLVNGMVYVSFASHCDNRPFHGWMMAYNAQSLQQAAVWNSTPNGDDGGIWQSGSGPAADASGNVFLATGNGTFDLNTAGPDAGDSILKFGPPSGENISILDYFTPFNQLILSADDIDLGSGGVILLPDQPAGSPHQHLLVEASKEGSLYLVNRDSMGHYNSSGDTQIVQLISGLGGFWATPAFWNNFLYCGGTNDALQAFTLNPTSGLLSTSPQSTSQETYSFPGSTPSISANGNTDGIVWALEEDSASTIVHAYDATNLSNELFNTSNNAEQAPGPAVKFAVPTIANGKVYVGTQTQLAVYGLFGLPPAAPTLLSPENGAIQVSTTPVLSWNGASGATSYDVYLGTSASPALVANITGTSYNAPALLIDTVYYWKIAARNSGGTAPSATWSFTTANMAGLPTLLTASTGVRQSAAVNTLYPLPIQATVTDAGGNPLSGISVTFAAPSTGPSGSFAGNATVTVTTDAQGVAAAPPFTANAVTGSYLVTATAGSLSCVFTLTNVSIARVADDFNADGHPDIVWQDPVSGSSQVWFLNGSQEVAPVGAAALSLGNSWQIVAVADFNGDGYPDVVWQDAGSGSTQVWFLGSPGTTVLGSAVITDGNSWRIVAAGDFNRDGYPDLVWQDPVSGLVQIWYLGGPQGTTVTASANLTMSNTWHVAAAGDFNGDGQPDLVWQDPVSGAVQIWYLGGPQGNVVESAVNLTDSNSWRIASVADFDGDGHPDVVWQDPVSGSSQVWFLNGPQGTSLMGTSVLSGPNAWRIVGPR
jgi:hypothetical protein